MSSYTLLGVFLIRVRVTLNKLFYLDEMSFKIFFVNISDMYNSTVLTTFSFLIGNTIYLNNITPVFQWCIARFLQATQSHDIFEI